MLQREVSLVRLSPADNFLFLGPPLIWNIALTKKLSMDAFDRPVPAWYESIEWGFRLGAMVYPVLLPIEPTRSTFAPGLAVYSVGLLACLASWIPFMVDPVPRWARSPLFEFAPAYLPVLWLGGISLMSRSWVHAALSVVLVVLHVGEYVQSYGRRRRVVEAR